MRALARRPNIYCKLSGLAEGPGRADGSAPRDVDFYRPVLDATRDPKKPCVYVGLTGLTPEERFPNHKAGIKDASLVKRQDLRLRPDLYAHLNPMPNEAAVQMENDLAEDLRRAGYTVTGGH